MKRRSLCFFFPSFSHLLALELVSCSSDFEGSGCANVSAFVRSKLQISIKFFFVQFFFHRVLKCKLFFTSSSNSLRWWLLQNNFLSFSFWEKNDWKIIPNLKSENFVNIFFMCVLLNCAIKIFFFLLLFLLEENMIQV